MFSVDLTVEAADDVASEVWAPQARFPWLSPKEASFSSPWKGWRVDYFWSICL